MAPLDTGLPPARRRFTEHLRDAYEKSGSNLRNTAHRAKTSPASLSRFLRGERLPSEDQVHGLAKALAMNDTDRMTLAFLHQQAMSEAGAPRSDRHQAHVTELANRLAGLRQKAGGLSLREISNRLTLMGSPVGKSTIERTFADPDRSPLLALQVATVLIEALPEDERGPEAEQMFRTVLAAAPSQPSLAVVTASTGSGKTYSALTALHDILGEPSEVTAALARRLDLPFSELTSLREAAAADRTRAPGRPINEWNPIELEVHPTAPRQRESEHRAGIELPPYIRRAHDRFLDQVVRDASKGDSQILVVVGASGTGKTRACWEAIQPLAQQGWRLWHPFNPARAEALLDGIDHVEPQTVLWLNEAEHYLLHPDLGEKVAYALRRLLTQPERGPILVLGTLWPEYMGQLTAPAVSGHPGPHAQARQLLAGRTIPIPETFGEEELRSADALDDPLLTEAARSGGRITQYLAGTHQLVHRYDTATPAAKAVLHAAMDAWRLGVGSPLPQDFLIEAAAGYLTDTSFDMLAEDWAEQAFADLVRPVAGGSGPLRRVRSLSEGQPAAAPARMLAPARAAGATYRLADYLETYGRTTRRLVCPPASFWHASYTHLTAPEDLETLADAADDRYRLQWAHHLRRRAAEVSDDQGLIRLTQLREEAGDRAEAEHLACTAADAGYTSALRELVRMREQAGDLESAQYLARQAAHYGDGLALAELAWTREEEGDFAGAEQLAQDAAAVGDTFALRELARMRETTGDRTSSEALYRQAADLGDTRSLLRLAEMREEAGDRDEAEYLARTAANTDDDFTLISSARVREKEGDREEAEALYRQAADAGYAFALAALARMREDAGDRSGAEVLYRKTADAGLAWLVNPARRWPYGLDPDGAPTPPWE
jgi:transcriptional regulator with XRE-family HTH domain